jgi:hypothetical protein
MNLAGTIDRAHDMSQIEPAHLPCRSFLVEVIAGTWHTHAHRR